MEDVFRVRFREPKGLDGNRVHIAGEAIDELAPGIVVARTAACNELSVSFDNLHDWNQSATGRPREASTASS